MLDVCFKPRLYVGTSVSDELVLASCAAACSCQRSMRSVCPGSCAGCSRQARIVGVVA